MAGTITATVRARRGAGIVRLRAGITVTSGGAAGPTSIGAVFGRIVGVLYAPGTLLTGATVIIRDADSGANLITLTNAGTVNRHFRPTANVTDANGVVIAAAATAIDVHRDIYVAGPLQVVVTGGGTSTSGAITLLVEEG